MLVQWSKKFNLKRLYLIVLIAFSSIENALSTTEYELKAAFLYNLTNFITWPSSAFASENAPFILCILGADPFGDALNAVTANQKVGGQHAIQVTKIKSEAEAAICHVIFIPNSEKSSTPRTLAALRPYPILTVSDTEELASSGVMIMFFTTAEGKVKLGINPERVAEVELKASAKLLQIAKPIGK